ncbi:ImmA/IrrE family metallo-endopeptidase [Dactylosporangium sp. CA-139066]|uniref:ImmA/IrrE family metallo-endopeptidase n=1 Tax=Dactylosporangium sp. CA-139066 TaxID=3239930 RepID=UPI003D8B46F9
MARYSDDDLVLTLVRQAGAVLDDLGLPGSFTLAELQARIEARRGRPIQIHPRPMPAEGPHGLWVAGERVDYVFVDAAAPPLRRAQIIGHEFGHILFDAPSAQGCARSGYEELIEQRCEWFGTVALQRFRLLERPGTP